MNLKWLSWFFPKPELPSIPNGEDIPSFME